MRTLSWRGRVAQPWGGGRASKQRRVAFGRRPHRRGARQALGSGMHVGSAALRSYASSVAAGPGRGLHVGSAALRCKQRRRGVRLRSAGAFASAAQRCVLSLNAQMLPQRKCRRHRRMFNTFLQNGYEMMTKPCILLLEQTQTK